MTDSDTRGVTRRRGAVLVAAVVFGGAFVVFGLATVGLFAPGADSTVVALGRLVGVGCGLGTVVLAGVTLWAELGRFDMAVAPLPAVVGAIGTTGALVAGSLVSADPTLVILLMLPAVLIVLGTGVLVGIGLRARVR